MKTFYALNLLSGFFEIAPLILALNTFGTLQAFIIVLFYQFGNLIPCPVRLSTSFAKVAAIAGVALLIVFFVWGGFAVLCVSVTLISAAIQSIRSAIKTDASKPAKRWLRVVGFGLGFITTPTFLPVAGLLVAVIVGICKTDKVHNAIIMPRLNAVNISMIFHQIHYFPYCYAVIMISLFHIGAFPSLLLFLAGWVTYILGARLYKGRGLLLSFFIGHGILLALLLGMFFVPSLSVKAFLWILTGLVGTTEFCIVNLARQRGGNKEGEAFAENAGHVLGVACGLAAYALTGNLLSTLLVGAGGAIGAMVLIAILYGGEKYAHSDG